MRTWWLIVLLGIGVTLASGGIGLWKTYTAKRQVRDIARDYHDSTLLWVATSGGMFSYRLSDNSFKEYTTSEGLRAIDLTAITVDNFGTVWIGASNGFLHRYYPKENEWQYISQIAEDKDHGPSKRINALRAVGDTLFILSDIGVSVFSISEVKFKDNYLHKFVIKAKSIEIFNANLWIGTESGIAYSPLSNPNPSAPDLWQVYTTVNGLPSNAISKLSTYNGQLIAGTSAGLSFLSGTSWITFSGTANQNIVDFKTFTQTGSYDTSLFFITSNQLWVISRGNSAGLVSQFNYTLNAMFDSTILATENDGLLISKNNSWIVVSPPGPPSNRFVGIAVDQKGVVWSGTGTRNGEGFMSFDGKIWKSYTVQKYPKLAANEYYKVSIGSNNSKWVSNWGAGVAILDDNGIIRKVLNTSNGLLPCVPNNPNYAVVGGIATDRNGVTWITSRTPPGDTSLVQFYPDSSFKYVVGCGINCRMRNPYNVFTDVVIDDNGTKWFANFNRFEPEQPLGLYFYNENYNLSGTFNGWGKLTYADGLTSNQVWSLAVDRDNNLWIGSEQGITIIFDPSYPRNRIAPYHPLHDQVIQTIAVDVCNNKWIATKQGVFVLSPDGTSIIDRYTSENSDGKLPDNDVTSVAIDHSTGTIYFGTEKGLASFTTSAIAPKQAFGELLFSPNPYYLPNSTTLTVDGLVESSSLKIMTLDGNLVRELRCPCGRIGFWDGRNEQGNYVSSGIYLVAAYSENGSKVATGKLAVIRK